MTLHWAPNILSTYIPKTKAIQPNYPNLNRIVRLNLINYLVGLFCAKFACILAISNPVFRWESCKGSV